MTIEEKRRELFESRIVLPDGVKWCPSLRKYIGKNFWLADYAWEAFNAALDAIEIELPSGFTHHTGADYTAYVIDADQVVDAIESLNLGIKIK